MSTSVLTSQTTRKRVESSTPTPLDTCITLLAVIAFPAALAVWLAYDYSYPMWDAASHVHDSIQYERLFRHPHINAHWIKEFLTVNPAYPMTIHATNGLLKAVFGIGRLTEAISLVGFSVLLSASVYGTAKILLKDKRSALIAVAVLNCYPIVSLLSHSPMLDFPQLSLCCLAMFTLVWWQSAPGIYRAVVAGVALGLAATSKQTAALYLIGPCLFLLTQSLFRKQFGNVRQLLLTGLITASFLGVWVLPNLAGLKKYMDYNGSMCQTNRTLWEIFCAAFSAYVDGIQGSMSPLLLLVSLVSVAYLAWKQRQLLWTLILPAISAVSGIVLMSLQSCNNPEPRYIVPAFLFTALATGAALGSVLKSKFTAVIAFLVVALAVAQFILFNYSPYPIALSPEQAETIRTIAGHPKIPGKMEPAYNPTPNTDLWRQRWCINYLARRQQPTALNILPSTPELSPHTMNLAAVYEGARVECSTFRQYTIRGDIVRYDEAAIKTYPWYLIKTGFQGFAFKNKESEDNYNRIIDYVEHSGNYVQFDQTTLPDGSLLKLLARKI